MAIFRFQTGGYDFGNLEILMGDIVQAERHTDTLITVLRSSNAAEVVSRCTR